MRDLPAFRILFMRRFPSANRNSGTGALAFFFCPCFCWAAAGSGACCGRVMVGERLARVVHLVLLKPRFRVCCDFRLFVIPFDDPGVVLGAGALVEKSVGYRPVAAHLVMAIQGKPLASRLLASRADMNLRLPVDPLLFERTVVDAAIVPGAFERPVHVLAPFFAQALRAPVFDALGVELAAFLRPCGGVEKAAAGFDVAVAEYDMRVRVPVRLVFLVEFQMQRKMPRHPVLGDAAAEAFDGLDALFGRQLARQRADETVGHARVFAVGFFLRVEPGARLVGTGWNDVTAHGIGCLAPGIVGGVIGGAAPVPELGQMGVDLPLRPVASMLLKVLGIGAQKRIHLRLRQVGVVVDIVTRRTGVVGCLPD